MLGLILFTWCWRICYFTRVRRITLTLPYQLVIRNILHMTIVMVALHHFTRMTRTTLTIVRKSHTASLDDEINLVQSYHVHGSWQASSKV
jgi:hypothetical protein